MNFEDLQRFSKDPHEDPQEDPQSPQEDLAGSLKILEIFSPGLLYDNHNS